MNYENISYETIGPVVRILQNRPASRNAQNMELLDELDQAVSRAVGDAEINVIIIGGTGDHFSSGHDLKDPDMLRAQQNPEDRYEYENLRYYEYCLRIWDAPKPIIAQVQGACPFGAFMVANMCDLIVASDDAYFIDGAVSTFATAAVEVLVHPWVMGLRRAKHFLYTGARMSAEEALAIGMVNEVVPRTELENATLALAEKIAESSPFALRLIKRSLNRTADIQGFKAALSAHFDTHQLSHMGTDYQAKVTAGVKDLTSRGKPRRPE